MFRPGNAKKLPKKLIVCFVGALGGFRVLPDAFFVVFWPNVGWILRVFSTEFSIFLW